MTVNLDIYVYIYSKLTLEACKQIVKQFLVWH